MPRDHRLDFGIYIAIRREELGLTGTDVGAACGTTQSAYSDWERCKRLPESEEQVRALAAKLSLPVDRLLEIWRETSDDVKEKGWAIVTRAYDVTSRNGGTSSDPY